MSEKWWAIIVQIIPLYDQIYIIKEATWSNIVALLNLLAN